MEFSLKRMERAVRRFARGLFAPKETVKYLAYGGDQVSGDAGPAPRALIDANQSSGAQKPRAAGDIYIQIGAGAGDQDARANYRDGFTERVKKLAPQTVGRILLVEPNPFNIPALQRCWDGYPQAEIYQYGVVPKRFSGTQMNFYYLPADAPHYQVASVNAHHVLKHYRTATMADLKVLPIETIDLGLFVQMAAGGERVELLCLDIEGVDAEVLLDTELEKLNVRAISFEHIHLGARERAVISHFEKAGFVKTGEGIDTNNYDWLFEKSPPGGSRMSGGA